jgi:hypothetical protein
MRCPKCGSDQVLNDECLKCGVLVSKAHSTTSTSMKPISYVAPETTAPNPEQKDISAPVWRPPAQDRVVSIPIKPKKGVLERNLLNIVILILLVGGGYQLYTFIKNRASAYSGYYRNNIYYFGVTLPEKGWSHYQGGDIKKKEFKDAHDAFYRGSNPNDPEVAMLIWSEPVMKKKVPRIFDEDTSKKMLKSIELEILRRMEGAGLHCEITEASRKKIAGNDGFVVHANVNKKDLFMKTIIYCGFNQTRAYTIQFMGNDEKMTDLQEEIERIINTFQFDINFI